MSIMSDVHDLISTTKTSVNNVVSGINSNFSPTSSDNMKSEKEHLLNRALAERFVVSHVKAYVEKRYDELKDQIISLSTDLSDGSIAVLPGTRHVVYEDTNFIYQINVKRGGTRLDTQKLKIALTRRGWAASEIDALVEEASNQAAPQTIHEIIPK